MKAFLQELLENLEEMCPLVVVVVVVSEYKKHMTAWRYIVCLEWAGDHNILDTRIKMR